MNGAGKQLQEGDFTNDTVLSTPRPRASSTLLKPQPQRKQLLLKKVPFHFGKDSPTESSLGTLSLNNLTLSPYSRPTNNENNLSLVTNTKLQQQRRLATTLLEKTATKQNYNLPLKYLQASDSIHSDSPVNNIHYDSTVNESDLIKPQKEPEDASFTPIDISTPRSSYASDEGSPRMSIERLSRSISDDLALFSHKIKNSNIDLSELVDQMGGFNDNDESFASGESALAKLDAYEKSWRKERSVLGGNSIKSDSVFSQLDNPSLTTQEGISVTEFFRKKSELADLCLIASPEKEALPVPLVDKSQSVTYQTFQESASTQNCSSINESGNASSIRQSISVGLDFKAPSLNVSNTSSFRQSISSINSINESSVLRLSEIERVISANDNTNKIMDYMSGKKEKIPVIKPKSPKQKKPKSRSHGLQNKTDLKENRRSCGDSCQSFKRHSLKPLKDSRNNAAADKSVGSLRTVSSLDSLPGGKLPLVTNRIELVWGCLKVGTKNTQTFLLRNKSQNKLRLQLCSSSANFKILKDNSELDTVQSLPILLHPAESRPFSIMFSPTNVGAMAERISFLPVCPELQSKVTKRQQLNLFGYGGYAQVEILDIPKDINLKMWLSLGKAYDLPELEKSFLIRNTGTLTAFAYLDLGSRALLGCSKSISIQPTEIVLQPKEEKTVRVTYNPTKEELLQVLAATKSQVVEIGYIQVINGEEPLRGRLRRLCRKLKTEAGFIGNALIENLINPFPEEKMPNDINRIAETVGSMRDLMQNLLSEEITLTFDRGTDPNVAEHVIGIDESSMFHSLIEGQQTMFLNTTQHGACIVEPSSIILTLPTKTEDNVVVTNQTMQSLQFQTTLTDDEVLEVNPSQGILSPGDTILLKISCDIQKLQQQQRKLFKLSIYIDDDVFEVDIKTLLIKSKVYS